MHESASPTARVLVFPWPRLFPWRRRLAAASSSLKYRGQKSLVFCCAILSGALPFLNP